MPGRRDPRAGRDGELRRFRLNVKLNQRWLVSTDISNFARKDLGIEPTFAQL